MVGGGDSANTLQYALLQLQAEASVQCTLLHWMTIRPVAKVGSRVIAASCNSDIRFQSTNETLTKRATLTRSRQGAPAVRHQCHMATWPGVTRPLHTQQKKNTNMILKYN